MSRRRHRLPLGTPSTGPRRAARLQAWCVQAGYLQSRGRSLQRRPWCRPAQPAGAIRDRLPVWPQATSRLDTRIELRPHAARDASFDARRSLSAVAEPKRRHVPYGYRADAGQCADAGRRRDPELEPAPVVIDRAPCPGLGDRDARGTVGAAPNSLLSECGHARARPLFRRGYGGLRGYGDAVTAAQATGRGRSADASGSAPAQFSSHGTIA